MPIFPFDRRPRGSVANDQAFFGFPLRQPSRFSAGVALPLGQRPPRAERSAKIDLFLGLYVYLAELPIGGRRELNPRMMVPQTITLPLGDARL